MRMSTNQIASLKPRLLCLSFVLLTLSCEKKSVIEGYPNVFAGIGVELQKSPQGPRIIKVLPDGPGYQAGMQNGDLLIAIDGIDLTSKSFGDVVVMLRGSSDSQVSITIMRKQERIIFVMNRKTMQKVKDDYLPSNSLLIENGSNVKSQ